MDAVSFYSHEHELAHIRKQPYEITNFTDIPESPVVERVLPIKGKQIPIMKIFRIAGTVLDRDKAKKTVTLLTTDGVVTVKVFGQVFAHYDKQISERGADGKKHVIEKSIFNRGNKIIVSGIRVGENEFLAKKYARTPWHLIEKIDQVNEDGSMIITCRETEND
jgi:DNA polymerase-3 subunit alpha